MNSHKRNNSTQKLIFLILSISYQTTHLKSKTHLKIMQIKYILLIPQPNPLKSYNYKNTWTINSFNNLDFSSNYINHILIKIHFNRKIR